METREWDETGGATMDVKGADTKVQVGKSGRMK
jgi:hypothetical protein